MTFTAQPKIWALVFALGWPPAGGAQSSADGEPPSAALLEFLGELDPVDDETWLLLEQNALRDLALDNEVQSE